MNKKDLQLSCLLGIRARYVLFLHNFNNDIYNMAILLHFQKKQ